MSDDLETLVVDIDASSADIAASELAKLGDEFLQIASVARSSSSALADQMALVGGGCKRMVADYREASKQIQAEGRANAKAIADAYEKAIAGARAAAKKASKDISPQTNFSNQTPTALQGSAKSASGFQGLVGITNKLFGANAAGALTRGAASLSDATDKLGKYAPLLQAGGKALAVGAAGAAAAAAAIAAAAVALAFGAAKLLHAGLELGIQQSAKKASAIGVLGKLDKGGAGSGTQDYHLALKVAAELGMDDVGPVVEQFKHLLQAGFTRKEIPLFIKAAADLGMVKGEEKGKAFLEQLTKLANKGGKANEESLNAMAEAGVSADAVLAKLAKKGESLQQVRARLKAGSIDAKTFSKAAAEAVEQQMGGIAGKGLFAAIGRLKLQLTSMFDGFDLKPIEEALGNVSKVLSGPGGKELKTGITKLFNALIKAFVDPFRGEEGQQRLTRIVKGVTKLAEVATDVIGVVAPLIARGIDGFSRLIMMDTEGSPLLKGLKGFKDTVVGLLTFDPAQITAGFLSMLEVLGVNVQGGAAGVGGRIIEGLISGIASGASGAFGAIVNVVKGMIDAAKGASETHSPSKAFERISLGHMQGLAKGANDNSGMAATATANAVGQSVGAGAGAAAGGAGGGAGGGGGGGVTIIVQVTAGPGVGDAQARAAGDAAGEAAYQAWMRNQRRFSRDSREGRAA